MGIGDAGSVASNAASVTCGLGILESRRGGKVQICVGS